MLTLEIKQIGEGGARVSFGSGERPKYAGLARAIQDYYQDLLRPLLALRDHVFTMLPIPTLKADAEPFRYLARHRRVIDEAVDLFLAEMAGPDRTRAGFVSGGMASDTPDGVLQQRSFLTYLVGVRRAGDVVDRPTTVAVTRESPAVKAMLDGAFTRLSESGKLRLEGVRDEIHSILVSATDAGLSPLNTARQLRDQFEQYQGFEFERLARTEAAFAAEAGTRAQFKEFGVQYVRWLLSANSCPICEAFADKIIPIEDEDDQPPGHPNCACSITAVTGDDLLGVEN